MGRDNPKVAVGLSGGVDSSVAAALLRDKGYDVIGVSMMIFDGSVGLKGLGKHACYGPGEKEDIDSAVSVCRKLGIPFHIIDLKDEFRRHVIGYFRSEYLNGRTPNPCIVCNQMLKFGFLLEKAKKSGIQFDLFATGHYAQIAKAEDRFLLKRPVDLSKDQTYFLYALSQKQLSRTIFPLGDRDNKEEVREIARSLGLKTSNRPESQDFIAGGDYSPLFKKGEVKQGDIIDEEGRVLGRHRGIIHYTIGQRRGLGIAAGHPLYVVGIDSETNMIKVSGRDALFAKGLIATDLNLIAVERLDKSYRGRVKIRLQHQGADAEILPDGKNMARIIFDDPQSAVTPGQSAVFYIGDKVLGGGIIEQALPL